MAAALPGAALPLTRRATRRAQTMRNLAEDFLVNKTIFFVGDSINGLVYHAAVRTVVRVSNEPRRSE